MKKNTHNSIVFHFLSWLWEHICLVIMLVNHGYGYIYFSVDIEYFIIKIEKIIPLDKYGDILNNN